MVPAGALTVTPIVVDPAPRSPIRVPLMTTSPVLEAMTAGLTPAEICRVEETRILPAMGVPAVIIALVSSVPVVGGVGRVGAAGGDVDAETFMAPTATPVMAPPFPT